jgi:hypothetical protein
LLRELDKLERIRGVGLTPDLFADVSDKMLAAWRARVSRCYPSDLRRSPARGRLTLLAALCWSRGAEVTDKLVDLIVALVGRIDERPIALRPPRVVATLAPYRAGPPRGSQLWDFRPCS